jgi:hypothetical protein
MINIITKTVDSLTTHLVIRRGRRSRQDSTTFATIVADVALNRSVTVCESHFPSLSKDEPKGGQRIIVVCYLMIIASRHPFPLALWFQIFLVEDFLEVPSPNRTIKWVSMIRYDIHTGAVRNQP